MRIYPAAHEHVLMLLGKEMRKERVAITKQPANTQYLCVMNHTHLIAAVGYMWLNPRHVRFKTAFTRNLFRGNKLYQNLFIARFFTILTLWKRQKNPSKVLTISAYCTPLSLGLHKRCGFQVQRVNKNGIAYVKLQIKSDEELQAVVRGIQSAEREVHQAGKKIGLDSVPEAMRAVWADGGHFAHTQ